jgi:hypothetical protein
LVLKIIRFASYPKLGNTRLLFLFTGLSHTPFEHSQTIFDVTPVLELGIDQATLFADRMLQLFWATEDSQRAAATG